LRTAAAELPTFSTVFSNLLLVIPNLLVHLAHIYLAAVGRAFFREIVHLCLPEFQHDNPSAWNLFLSAPGKAGRGTLQNFACPPKRMADDDAEKNF
jgi:hypothetical protein